MARNRKREIEQRGQCCAEIYDLNTFRFRRCANPVSAENPESDVCGNHLWAAQSTNRKFIVLPREEWDRREKHWGDK